MISTVTYNGDGATRVFPVAFEIRGEDYVVVFINGVGVSDRTKYDIINNSIVFREGDAPVLGVDNVKIVVATSPTEIADLNAPPSSIQTVLDNLAEIIDVSNSLTAITSVNDNELNINAVVANTTNINTVAAQNTNITNIATQVVPNIFEILLADNNAAIATTKANEASTSASEALASKNSALTSASNALTSETNAGTSEANTLSYKNSAEASSTTATIQAGIATTQAGIATTQAGIATVYAGYASTSATSCALNAEISLGAAEDAAGIQLEISTRRHDGEYISMDNTAEDFGDLLDSSPFTIENNTLTTDMAVSFGNLDCGIL